MKVFVYGTLKRPYGNHRLLQDSAFLGAATISGFDLYDLGAFPAIVESHDAGKLVHGELYEVDEHTFSRLDMLEGYPDFYDRKEVEVSMSLEEPLEDKAWVYFLHSSRGTLIPEGVWGRMG